MSKNILPIRRNKNFNFDDSAINYWHQKGPGVTQFLNAMSLFFPAGERYFIRSVRAFREQTPHLKEHVAAFIGQEAFHGREHEKMNKMLNTPLFDVMLERALDKLTDTLPDDFNLAATCALEHFTAILAQGLLEDISTFDESDESFRNVWIWHALEETDHKAVAFDVYDSVVKNKVYGYFLRCFSLIIGTVIFLVWLSERYAVLLHRNGQLNITNVVGTMKFLFVKPGTFLKAIPRWFDWFRPGFHPWDHDNSHELIKYEEFLES